MEKITVDHHGDIYERILEVEFWVKVLKSINFSAETDTTVFEITLDTEQRLTCSSAWFTMWPGEGYVHIFGMNHDMVATFGRNEHALHNAAQAFVRCVNDLLLEQIADL